MTPKSVTLNANKKSIQFEYDDNTHLLLNASYLRAVSPSAENKNRLKSVETFKKQEIFSKVSIDKIEAVGNYAIRIIFSDGHNTGIYSWEYIFNIGSKANYS